MIRLATPDDAGFILEMARHACVIEDWPLPDPESEETRSLLPGGDDVVVVAADLAGKRLGAAWTLRHDPPLSSDASPEIAIAVTPGMRGQGIGGGLLDELVARCVGTYDALDLNVHERNPASHLYQRKDFRVIGRGRGALGIAMRRELR
jgi:GNAT superfamily N-acetyltransferase